MLKTLTAALLFIFSVSTFACINAQPTNDVNFCASFKVAATCYCSLSAPPVMCQDMNAIYNRMISVFGSLQEACRFQRYTSMQDCIDNWNCYKLGGKDSRGRVCSSTGQACR